MPKQPNILDYIKELEDRIASLEKYSSTDANNADYATTAGDADTVDSLHASDFLPATSLVDSGWTAVTMLNSWVAYDNTYGRTDNTLIRKIGSIVYIRGLVKSGTFTTSAFTLPSGWRPAINMIFATSSIDLFHQVRINSDGNVIPYAGGNNGWCSLAVSFVAG